MKRKLVIFSGLAWNYKTTIFDQLKEELSDFQRLEQPNKNHLSKHPNATPMELFERFMTANLELIRKGDLLISDRSPMDYFFYDKMMNPEMNWLYPAIMNPYKCSDYKYYEKEIEILKSLSSDREVIWFTLENVDQKFLSDNFEDNYSSTSMLFDNPDKYSHYSRMFNQMTDRLDYYTNGYGIIHHHYKKYTSESIIDYCERVKLDVLKLLGK